MEIMRYLEYIPRLEPGAALYIRRVHLTYGDGLADSAGTLAAMLCGKISSMRDRKGILRGYSVSKWSAVKVPGGGTFIAVEIDGGPPAVQFRIRALGVFELGACAPIVQPLRSDEQWAGLISLHRNLGGESHNLEEKAPKCAAAAAAYDRLRSRELHAFREAVLKGNDPADRVIYWLCDSAGWAENCAHADYLAALGSVVVCRIPTERALAEALRAFKGVPNAIILDIVGAMTSADDHAGLYSLAQKARDGNVVPSVGRVPVVVFSDYVPRIDLDALEIERWAFCIPGPGRDIAQVICGRIGMQRAQQVVLENTDSIPDFADIRGILIALKSYSLPGIPAGEEAALDAAWKVIQNTFSADTLERYWRSGCTPILCLRWGMEIRLDPAALQSDISVIGGLSIIPRPMTSEQQNRCMEWLKRHRAPLPQLADINARRAAAGRAPINAMPEIQYLQSAAAVDNAPVVLDFLRQSPYPAEEIWLPGVNDPVVVLVHGKRVAIELDRDASLRSHAAVHRTLCYMESKCRIVRVKIDDIAKCPEWNWKTQFQRAVESSENVVCIEANMSVDSWQWMRGETASWISANPRSSASDYAASHGIC